ncbi:stringent starvation protein B [Variibacter gotjawalensis]|uniref:Stringent starvation protein B n=1 Tax=Variibacter gotjawalensis TaxID=1333996 RepID=A0A0S3PTV5_9BRAD|nr:ClpXP protease specificity-enhancing factor SspB [Variibacter gotjawalensis]NIK49658.1 hypothetical protein [Variibacter gotjawalensis]RZS45670.1 hypothetical protein EV661_3990 [Variibacter gotjawalensis]BAT59341.1 stringent starvation protein B [Variibacter gotjawalensis]
MSLDQIRYDLLVRDALRGVVKKVVADAARNGLPGDHHFFIAFYTQAPGVKMSPRLREHHPEEMTVVLQHQFWDLAVTDSGIEVGLSFKGVPEKLFIPFDAMKAFFDPSVQFGLEFEVAQEAQDGEEAADAAKAPAAVPTLVEKTETPEAPVKLPVAEKSSEPDAPPSGGAEVVQFDRFRKK